MRKHTLLSFAFVLLLVSRMGAQETDAVPQATDAHSKSEAELLARKGDLVRAAVLAAEGVGDEPQDIAYLAWGAKFTHDLGAQLFKVGKTDEANLVFLKASAICQRLVEKHTDLPASERNLATRVAQVLTALSAPERRTNKQTARDSLLASLSLGRQLFPDGDRSITITLHRLGDLYRLEGDYEPARRSFAEGVKIAEGLGASGKRALEACLNGLATTLRAQGTYSEARRHLERAIEIQCQIYGREHPSVAASLNNLGRLLESQGEFALARDRYAEAVSIHRELSGDQGSARLAMFIHNLGGAYESLHDYPRARKHYDEAFEMRGRFPDDEDVETATILSSIGMLLTDQGDYDEAETYHRRALALRQRRYDRTERSNGHPQLAFSLDNLGNLMWSMGDYARASDWYQRGLEMRRLLYPAASSPHGHPQLATSLDNLGKLALTQNQHARARDYCTQSMEMRLKLLDDFLLGASEAETLNFLELVQTDSLNQLLSAYEADATAGDLYELVWKGRRLIQRRMARRLSLARRRDQESVANYIAVRRALGRLALQPAIGPASAEQERIARMAELTDRKERLERELADIVAEDIGRTAVESDPSELAAVLPSGSLFVDIVQYSAITQDPTKAGAAGFSHTPRYVAFVVARNNRVIRVKLGSVKEIDALVNQWRSAIGDGIDHRDAARQLAFLVWEPISKVMGGDVDVVYLCCDGALNRIPWAAIPRKEVDSVLLDQHAIALVPSGQFLHAALSAGNDGGDEEPGEVLLVGDIDYEADLTKDGSDAIPSPAVRRSQTIWKKLPGTRAEIEEVKRLADASRQVRTLTGRQADVEHVLWSLSQSTCVHIATHGFFADPQFRSQMQMNEAVFRHHLSHNRGRTAVAGRSPLVLSGLVLAGANRSASSEEDPVRTGILTGEAIAGLPLADLRLAVLSACETSLGEQAGGEGVYGLQRAFHMAGARNVVASLWKVSDQATTATMVLFYRNLWVDGQKPLQALRSAQLTLYRHPELIESLDGTRSPDFGKVIPLVADRPLLQRAPTSTWASFVLSGSGN